MAKPHSPSTLLLEKNKTHDVHGAHEEVSEVKEREPLIASGPRCRRAPSRFVPKRQIERLQLRIGDARLTWVKVRET